MRRPTLRPPADRACGPAALVLVASLALPGGAPGQPVPPSLVESPGERVLLVAIDAVPWQIVADLALPDLEDLGAGADSAGESRRALFDDIGQPIPLVSSFPSTTTLAFSGMLEPFDAETPPGYEARFFDRERNRVRGGGLRSYKKIAFSWRDFFDWKIEGTLRKALGYARPLRFYPKEIAGLSEAFLSSELPVFVVYVSSGDAIGHLKGPAKLAGLLRAIDAEIASLRERSPDPFRVVVFSDHGMEGGEPLRNVRRALKRQAKRAGFRPRKRLEASRDLVLVPFGLLTSVVAYTREGEQLEAARALAKTEGISLCVAPQSPDSWRVFSATARAAIERRVASSPASVSSALERGGSRSEQFRYAVVPPSRESVGPSTIALGAFSGSASETSPGDTVREDIDVADDPLGYLEVARELAESRPRDASGPLGFYPAWQWFDATVEHHYPDALYRLIRGFDLVESPASVLCSVAPGYMYGPWHTEFTGRLSVGRLRYTHGALDRGDTLGFLVSDHPAWAGIEAVAFDRAFDRFAAIEYRAIAKRRALRAEGTEPKAGKKPEKPKQAEKGGL